MARLPVARQMANALYSSNGLYRAGAVHCTIVCLVGHLLPYKMAPFLQLWLASEPMDALAVRR